MVVRSRVGLALLTSLALSVVLITQVTLDFHAVRAKLVRSSTLPSDGVVRIDTSSAPAAKSLTAPFALIARIRNVSPSPDSARFDIRLDGRAVCRSDVPGADTVRRIDCAVTGKWDARTRHTIEVTGAPGIPWTLEYLEIATHHGSTRGLDLIVAPAASERQQRPGFGPIAVSFLVIAGVFLLPSAVMARWATRLYTALTATVAAFMLLIVVSPRVSPYSVLLSAKIFGGTTLLLGAPRVWFAATWLRENRRTAWSRVLRGTAVGVVVLAGYGAIAGELLRNEYGGNYSGFIQLSRAIFDRHPALSARDDVRGTLILKDHGGYDGQFMYYMTFDPFLRMYRNEPAVYGRFIDAPPYRYGRIGFSVLTRVFSGGRWSAYPRTMMWLILAALFGCGFTLATLAQSANNRAAWGLLILLVPSFWQSLVYALPEPIAGVMLLCGWLLLARGYAVSGALVFAASLLVRETGAILAVASAAALFVRGRRRDGLLVLVIALGPLLLWRLYVGWMLFPHWGAQAFFFNAHNLGLPFVGIAELWRTIGRGAYFPDAPLLARAGILYPILLCFGLVIAAVAAIKRPGAATVSAALYGIIAVSFTYDSIWVHVANAQRGTYELFIGLALVSLGTCNGPRALKWSLMTFWVSAALYILVGAFDADLIYRAIL